MYYISFYFHCRKNDEFILWFSIFSSALFFRCMAADMTMMMFVYCMYMFVSMCAWMYIFRWWYRFNTPYPLLRKERELRPVVVTVIHTQTTQAAKWNLKNAQTNPNKKTNTVSVSHVPVVLTASGCTMEIWVYCGTYGWKVSLPY